ncbi:synaptotagmin-2 [Astyanax mexicanus]|uniref:Synaptotagmin 2 n=1 Tax=Astyanax mexicanus TaxID=7994 RepID=A0A8B9KYF2_ASTMX|nr:synaptotagmin-2 [Astyanax mexicanus]KAG9273227.1 synaptotagmin-2-like [Astyanax mexicanus]
MSFPAPLENSFWDIRIPLSREVKFSILGISVTLLFVALCILLWQLCRYCTQPPTPDNDVISPVLDGQSYENLQNNSPAPHYQLECRHDEAERMSRCLSRSSDLASSMDSLGELDEERVQGTLRFSLFYDQLQSRLVVTVLEARGLAMREFSRSADPFVRLRLLWASKEDDEQRLSCVLQEWQTRLVKDSCNPMFGDQFSCILPEEDVSRVTVRMEVRDFDKFSRHGILGEVRAPLNSLNIMYPLEMMDDLQHPKKDAVGEVLLSLKYMPTSQRLEVGILKARTIFRSSKAERVLYARTSVLCNQCKIRHQRTPEKVRWDVTVFNEVMIFVLPDTQIRECSITVSIYEMRPGKKSSKRLIGQVTLGKSRNIEDEHWKLMMRSLRQPVAKWHLLFL